MLGLYVHVPFCLSKCHYCDFYSLRHNLADEEAYVSALLHEIDLKGMLWGQAADTLYFGGGTPSTLRLKSLELMLEALDRNFPRAMPSETTFEVNPGTVQATDFVLLRKLGINRLSIGLQSHLDSQLSLLGRPHNLADFHNTVRALKSAGFRNFSVDALYGLPGQTLGDYLATLDFIVSTGATHVSAYALQIEPGTQFALLEQQGRLVVSDEDQVADMMLMGRDFLCERGFGHYEISNFALPGYESKHNMLYWRNRNYLGFGPSAASFVGQRRSVNVADIDSYGRALGQGRLATSACEKLTRPLEMAETMILGLRMIEEGVNRAQFALRFGIDPLDYYGEQIATGVLQGLLQVDDKTLRLTAKGFPLASQVQMAFLP